MHLTLSFLGEQPLPRLRQLVHTLQATYADQPPVRLRLTGAGCFPPKGAPRVIYAGVDGGDPLLGLAACTKQAAKVCGITIDTKQSGSFTAHITLGRVREVADPARALALATSLKEMPAASVEQTASEALIMLSELRPTGAVHSVYARLPFDRGVVLASSRE